MPTSTPNFPPISSFSPKSRRALVWGALFLFINGFFVAKVPQATRPELANVSAAFVLVLWAPSFWALKSWLGLKRAVWVAAALGVFAVVLESLAIVTGFPYGHFAYGGKIGGKVFDLVPWTVPFSWPPLVFGAWALAARLAPKRTFAVAVLLLLAFDLVLDPGAVKQEFWKYAAGGTYYDVPFSNFCGWILSGSLGVWLFQKCCGMKQRGDTQAIAPLSLVSSVTLILAFWTSVCLFSSLWIPALVGFALLGVIFQQVYV